MSVSLTAWRHHGDQATVTPDPSKLPLAPGAGRCLGELTAGAAGMLVAQVISPRPLRMWVDGILVVDEPLWWRSFQRQVHCAFVLPVMAVIQIKMVASNVTVIMIIMEFIIHHYVKKVVALLKNVMKYRRTV